MPDVLWMDDVSRWFPAGGRKLMAGREVSFQIAEAELLVVLGRSGSGKSTLLSLCGGLDRPDVGRVLVGGRDVALLRGAARETVLQWTVGRGGWGAPCAGGGAPGDVPAAHGGLGLPERRAAAPAHRRRERRPGGSN